MYIAVCNRPGHARMLWMITPSVSSARRMARSSMICGYMRSNSPVGKRRRQRSAAAGKHKLDELASQAASMIGQLGAWGDMQLMSEGHLNSGAEASRS